MGLFVCSLLVSGQRDYIYGVVRDSTTQEEMIGVHIRNISAGLLTSSGAQGEFRIPAQKSDTLVISSVGYQTLAWVVKQEWFANNETDFLLPAKTIYLDEVVVGKFPEYIRFKEQLINMKAEDSSFQVYGVPKVTITREDRINASLKARGPVSLLYNTFIKRAKVQKKLREVLQNQETTEKAQQKFTRDWVAEHTKLEGDKLTSFIAYCNFSEMYIATTPEYIIYEDMIALLPKFLENCDECE